jgi:uncharacterized repeat protein (TIGR04076 family)
MGKIEFAIEIEIYEGQGCDAHQKGERFTYPQEVGKICPWLMDSLNGMIRVLQFGGTLSWSYQGTPYEKEIEADGSTTEFVRCPDPTSAGVVAKITRRKLSSSREVGWA